jgi:ABC-type molybdate transport system substrate-binding protein
MTFIPELLQVEGTHILGPLPPPFGHATGYAAAVSSGSPNRAPARAFIAALAAPASRDVWVRAGFAVG